MRTSFEVRSGRRPVTLLEATTAQEAVLDYVRSLGCRDNEIRRVGADTVSWRGVFFSAGPAESHALQRDAA
jgi:hypothetical protein